MIVEENEAEDINDKILEKIGLKQSENEHLLTIFEDLKFTQPRFFNIDIRYTIIPLNKEENTVFLFLKKR